MSLLIAFMLAQATSASEVTLGDIQVRLFYKASGRLSDDILSRKADFMFFNTIIGEGDAEESADDLLVTVVMNAGKFGAAAEKERFVGSPVTIVAQDGAGKILGKRIFATVLTSAESGAETKALWLNDVTCAGEVTIKATFSGQSKSAKILMGCGE